MKKLRIVSALALVFFCSLFTAAQKPVKEPLDFLVTISTPYGNIKVLLYDDTPLHKANFIKLSQSGFYNHTTFHRIINGFMVQGGEDTTSFSKGKPFEEISLPAEILPHRTHKRGALSMARPENPAKRSDRTQFFIVQGPNGSHFLDGQYTVFGEVMSGMEVVDIIAQQEKDLNDRPTIPIRMTIKAEKVSRSEILKFYNYSYR